MKKPTTSKKKKSENVETNTNTYLGNSRAPIAEVIDGNVDCKPHEEKSFSRQKNQSISFEKLRDNDRF